MSTQEETLQNPENVKKGALCICGRKHEDAHLATALIYPMFRLHKRHAYTRSTEVNRFVSQLQVQPFVVRDYRGV